MKALTVGCGRSSRGAINTDDNNREQGTGNREQSTGAAGARAPMTPAQLVVWTASVAETLNFGRRIGSVLQSGWVIGLIGELGVGKTHLAKGIAAGNAGTEGPAPEVTSPTFVLVNEYSGRVTLFHLDAYRLSADRDLEDLGIAEMMQQGAVMIEWADRVGGALPADRITIAGTSTGESEREWTLTATWPKSNEWLQQIASPLE